MLLARWLTYCTLIAVTVGCSTTSRVERLAESSPVDVNLKCDRLANYARVYSTLRDLGLRDNGFAAANASYLFNLRRWVYDMRTTNPAEAYMAVYVTCDEMGYDRMIEALQHSQE